MAKPAFVVVDVDVKDVETYKRYRAEAPPIIAKHGGIYVARGGDVTHMEPGWGDLHRIAMLRFPSVAAAKAWYNSPEYQRIVGVRLGSTKSRMFIVEGLDPDAPLPA